MIAMQIIASLIREFPIGSLIVILSALWAGERVVTSFINRNKPPAPKCECECCDDGDEDEEEDED